MFGGGSPTTPPSGKPEISAAKLADKAVSWKGPTNEIVRNVKGMRHRRLGGTGIVVSELGLGTQRWLSTDFNAPNQDLCFDFLDKAILDNGVNLIDTAEQYPIPSDGFRINEGDTEKAIGKWLKSRNLSREKVVISTKIIGGRNVTPKNIKTSCKYLHDTC